MHLGDPPLPAFSPHPPRSVRAEASRLPLLLQSRRAAAQASLKLPSSFSVGEGHVLSPGSGKEVGEGAICFSFLDLLRTEHPVFLLSHLPVLGYLEAAVILIKKKETCHTVSVFLG